MNKIKRNLLSLEYRKKVKRYLSKVDTSPLIFIKDYVVEGTSPKKIRRCVFPIYIKKGDL